MNIYAKNCNCRLCSRVLIVTVLKNKMWPMCHILEQCVSVWIALVIWALMMRRAGLANHPGRTKSESLTVLLLKNISFFKCATLPSWHCTKRYTVWDLDQGVVGIKKRHCLKWHTASGKSYVLWHSDEAGIWGEAVGKKPLVICEVVSAPGMEKKQGFDERRQ